MRSAACERSLRYEESRATSRRPLVHLPLGGEGEEKGKASLPMPLIAVAANDIDTSGVTLDVELPLAWLEQELREADVTGAAPGHLSARLSRSGTEIVVRGSIDVKLKTPCARCLNPTALDVRSDLSLLLKPAPGSPPRGNGSAHRSGAENGALALPRRGKEKEKKEIDYEFSAEEADNDTFDGETVVLDEFVREAILLELPNFPLCSEACPGIGPVAPASSADSGAASARVDPRLAPLGALRDKLRKTADVTSSDSGSAPSPRPPRPAARPLLRSSSAAIKTKKKKRNKE